MAIQIADGFQLRVAKPLDDRQNVETVAQLDPTYGYEGQIVYVKDIQQFYTCYKDENGSLAYKIMETGSSTPNESAGIELWVSGESYEENDFVSYNDYIYRCKIANNDTDFVEDNWQKQSDTHVEITEQEILDLLDLTDEELETMAHLIDDSAISLNKTYSSSKIHADIRQCLQDSKDFTLGELGKKIGASYEVVTSADDMVSQDYLYLLNNGNGYDIYIVDVDNIPVVIGDTTIDLSNYYTKQEVDNDFLKKADAELEYATKIELDDKIDEKLANFAGGGAKATLVTNTTNLKLDVTKMNSSWYGAIKLTYLYDTSPAEMEISFRDATEDLRWAVINGQKYVKQITFTQDSSNTAHYTIGIEFSGTTYGCYQAEVIGGFADINSLTSEAFTGDKTAVYYSPWGKNNGVTLVGAPEDIELTFPCTTVNLAQAMRNKFNKTLNAGAIGVFICDGKATTITDAPSDFGLLHIETFGHDKILIRYDGIRSATHTGSWIGQIKGNNGKFSSITWSRIDNDTRVTTLETQVSELFQSVSSGKTLVANAITGKGVSTATDATFATMATNISKISGCKEETKSYNNTSSGLAPITLTFSANVLGVKQIIPPTYSCRITTQTSGDIFTINGKELTFYVNGAGTWEVTAIVK